jgi:hypothetical protein
MAQHSTIAAMRETWRLDGGVWLQVRNVIAFIFLLSWAGALAGYFLDRDRFFQSYLTGFVSVTVIALGCLFFLMVMYLTGSAWSVTMRRFFETIAAGIPLAAILVIPVLLGIHNLYEWSHADHVAHDHILQGKAPWLNENGFILRSFVYIAIWSLIALKLYKNSTRQDETHSLESMHSSSRWSAPGLLVVFLTVTAASFDWVMSLNPHWYSTIFGIYVFAGGGLASMATVTLICASFRRFGILRDAITIEHYHDLGKWMFALTVFWTYIAFSQYMLIWYANLAEETVFYIARREGTWLWMSLALIFGHFLVPFFVLIQRRAKRSIPTLVFAAIWILIFCYIDVYWLIMPNFHKEGIAFSWQDIACWGAVASSYAMLFWARLRKHSLVPEGDFRLEQSLAHINI